MARARNIKPSFFQNEELGELSPIERLAFIGMWTIADYKGCIEFRPKRLKVQLLPYDECDFEQIAINLDKSGFIRMYSWGDQRYIKIINFEKHQNPHKNERDAGSDIPDIDEKPKEINSLQKIEINPDKDGTTRADSLIPLTDSLEDDDSQKRESLPSKKCTFKTWKQQIKVSGEKLISDYKPVWDYASKVGISDDWIQIAWIRFADRYENDKNSNRKLYTDWRWVFLRAIKENWFKLWYEKDGGFVLTTIGVQADIETREAA